MRLKHSVSNMNKKKLKLENEDRPSAENEQVQAHTNTYKATLDGADCGDTNIEATSATLTAAQARASYRQIEQQKGGKPVYQVPTRTVLKLQSAFEHKGLCDGPTLTLDLSCYFSCRFCFVENSLCRHPAVQRIQKETGLSFQEFVIKRENPLPVLRRELTGRDGLPKYPRLSDRRVVFTSPLADVAANLAAARQTIAACLLILENTNWQIRLLSKSALLKVVAEGLAAYRDRVIFGFSTGTFDDRLAASFELRCSSPSARIRALHWLQDAGFRTFGMICPSLPQEDYAEYARNAAAAVRVDRCEHVWAEVLNVRGKSLANTCAGLVAGGFDREANALEQVSGPRNRAAWEEYARATFLAHSQVVPPEKLRFMQYVQAGSHEWWAERKNMGAVLLGKHAKVDDSLPNEISREGNGGGSAI